VAVGEVVDELADGPDFLPVYGSAVGGVELGFGEVCDGGG
jgi:hypothetical protein